MVNEVRLGLRDTVICKVARRREERAFEGGNVFSGKRTVTLWLDSDCHIKSLRNQIHVAVTEVKTASIRISGCWERNAGSRGGYPLSAECIRYTHPKPSMRAMRTPITPPEWLGKAELESGIGGG